MFLSQCENEGKPVSWGYACEDEQPWVGFFCCCCPEAVWNGNLKDMLVKTRYPWFCLVLSQCMSHLGLNTNKYQNRQPKTIWHMHIIRTDGCSRFSIPISCQTSTRPPIPSCASLLEGIMKCTEDIFLGLLSTAGDMVSNRHADIMWHWVTLTLTLWQG